MTTALRSLSFLAVALALLVSHAGAQAQATYATAESASEALLDAVIQNDDAALARVLGKSWRELFPPQGVDPRDRQAFLDKAREAHAVQLTGDRGALVVGIDEWAFPVPLVRTSAGQWRFDVRGGREALLERQIGANERSAIGAALAYVDAQREYASADRNGDGVLEYARRLVSSPGKRDGLIWSGSLGDESPLGEDFLPTRPNVGYHGYRFRILEAQGPHAALGARSFLIGQRLLSGYALIAYPVAYGRTGVMTFIVNQDGEIYQRDLGPDTRTLAARITRFDPSGDWQRVMP